MEKLKLSTVNFAGAEVLTREQLKKIMGSGTYTGDCGTYPNCSTTNPCVSTVPPCKDVAGTCAKITVNSKCGCAVVC